MLRACASSRLPASVGTAPRPLRRSRFWRNSTSRLLHLPADRRLRDAEQPRGAAEAAEVDDGDEVFELLQVHGDGRIGRAEARSGAIERRPRLRPPSCRIGIAASVAIALSCRPGRGANLARHRSAPADRPPMTSPIRIVSSMATRQVLAELVERSTRRTRSCSSRSAASMRPGACAQAKPSMRWCSRPT